MNANLNAVKSRLQQDANINYYDLVDQVEKDSIELVRYYIRLSGSSNKK